MNAIIYIRVSTTEQAELGYSLRAQKDTCQEYSNKNNFTILKVFEEKGESAKTINRTELGKLLEYIDRNKNINALIVYKVDRLSRNVYDALGIRLKLKKLNIRLISVTEPYDESAFGNFIQLMLSGLAQLDNEWRSEKTVSGMKQTVKEGRWVWVAPFGYKHEKRDGKSFLVFSDKKEIVERIFSEFLSGKRVYEIANRLSNNGNKYSNQKILDILSNPIYMGKIKTKFFDTLIDGIHDPIISELDFYRVQKKLNGKTKSPYQSELMEDFPLKGFLKCPECNRNLRGSWSKGWSKKYPYYHCTNKGCIHKPIRKEKAEELFVEYLSFIRPSKDALDKLLVKLKQEYLESQKLSNEKIKNTRRYISELE